MITLTLGDVPYLNTKPLVATLNGRRFEDLGVEVHVVEAVPSRLAGMLERREVATAVVSSVVPLSDPSLCALSVGAVTSDGPVASIRLLSRVHPSKIRMLALDTSSRTSVILCRVLLSMVYGIEPEVISHPPDVPAMLDEADAALIIGDPALRASVAIERGELPQVREDFDLGSLWRSVTGLPFVYAVWAAPRDGNLPLLRELLGRAAAWGVTHIDEIAEREAPRAGLTVDYCRRYLTENISYSFGPREWEGLRRFHAEAVTLGLLPGRADPLECIDGAERDGRLQALENTISGTTVV